VKRNALAILAAAATFAALGAGAGAQSLTSSPEDQWGVYKRRFISSEGRLIDDSARNVSHSEGQGFAMLLAQFASDRETFDKLWTWTIEHLQIRSDGLAAWRWRPDDNPHVLDQNNATDGDLLIAWALAEAGRRWHEPIYDDAAATIVHAIDGKLIYHSVVGKTISPGLFGFGPKDGEDGPVVNLSYWVFPAFEALHRVAPDVDWNGLKHSGLELVDAAKFGPRRLPSDWISLASGIHPAKAYPERFGYDVVRVPLYLAWGLPRERDRLNALMQGWAPSVDAPLSVVDIESGEAKEQLADPGYRAIAAFAFCVAHQTAFPDDLKTVDFHRYYPATLQMLVLNALREGRYEC
jgi:endoglucanase